MLRHEKALQDYARSHVEEQYRLRKETKEARDTSEEEQQPRNKSSIQPFAWLRRLIMSR
ncbi:MAG: hypothetical protein AAGF95_21710 [Chloroflexota bacterium]